jgi:hypothetical protein
MKILRVADVPDHRAGGMARMMHFSADALRADGHEVDFSSAPTSAAGLERACGVSHCPGGCPA